MASGKTPRSCPPYQAPFDASRPSASAALLAGERHAAHRQARCRWPFFSVHTLCNAGRRRLFASALPITASIALSIAACLPAGAAQAATLLLENAQWSVRLDPGTLAITATPTAQPAVVVSSGSPARPVSGLQGTPTSATWQWNDGAYDVSARLAGQDLHLSITARQPGTVTLLRQPPDAWGRGLILPLAEGAHIPPQDRVWRDFLLQHKASLDTSQDLSLPMWGLDHSRFSLSWLLTHPFNNRIRFVPQGPGLALTLEHTFTPMDVRTPMTLLLHLGDADLLAGAKR